MLSRPEVYDSHVRLFDRTGMGLVATRNRPLRNALIRSAFELADDHHFTEEKKEMRSRIPVLIGLVLLIVTLSVFDVTVFPVAWSGALPYIIIGLILFLVMSSGGCCSRACRRKADDSEDTPPAA